MSRRSHRGPGRLQAGAPPWDVDRLMEARLPAAETTEQFDQLRRDEARLGPGVRELCHRLQLGGEAIERFAGGSLPVYAVGAAQVLKLYPPCYRGDFDTERACLELLEGRLPVPAPRLHASGEQDGWAYLLMERLAGRALADLWPELGAADREDLAAQLGEAAAALHAIDPGAGPIPRPDWPAFVRAQRAGCVERQRAGGLAAGWLEQIPEFLASVPLEEDPRRALLHTELMREHVFAIPTARGWRLSGLIDLEPAMVGAPEYEFASVGLFVSAGDRALLRRFLLAYGTPAGALDHALRRRLLGWALLHRYSNLRWYLERLPAPETPSLEALAESWWAA